MFQNASPAEVWYTVPSAIGLGLAALLLYLSVGDEVRRRRTRVNGLLRLDVQKSIVTATALLVAQGCLTKIGVNQMMTPPNPLIGLDPVTASTTIENALLFVLVDVSVIVLICYRLLQRGAVGRALAHAEQVEQEAAAEALRRDRRAGDQAAPAPGGKPC